MIMRCRFNVSPLCILLLLASLTVAQATIRQEVLDNGLTVLIEENHTNPVVAVRIFVRTGSMYEQEFLGSGISHFFEHIIHGGTTGNRTEAESRTLLETIGNNTNAYTTTDHTAYYINTTTEHWITGLDLLGDWMLNSKIEQEEFEREKGVVQREIEQGLDNPRRVLSETVRNTRFKVHPARYPVIGYSEFVQQVSRDDLVAYYNRMYAPNNMILVVVGDVTYSDAMVHIRKAFGHAKRRHIPAITLPSEPPQVRTRRAVKEMPIAQAHMSLSFRTVNLTHPDLYPLDVLSYILSNGDSSRLIKRVKDEQQLVYGIRSSSFTPSYAPGSLSIWSTLESKHLSAAEAAILLELNRLKSEPVSAAELDKAKKQKIAEHIFNRETVKQRSQAIGIDMLSTYDPDFSTTYVRNIQKVTAEDIRRVARQYIRPETMVVAVVKPQEQTLASSAEVQTPSADPIVKKVLSNGMTLLMRRNPALPTVTLQAYFKGGVRVETPDTNGLSQLMARLLLKGTTTRGADVIATTFDAMGGSIDANSGNNSFFVNAMVLKDDFQTALQVLADVILNPTFPEAELEKMRRLMLAALARQDDNWGTEIGRLFRATHFSVSPYAMQPGGSEQALQKLNREHVLAFHKKYAKPQNMVLAIFGDIDPAATLAAAEQEFADFQAALVEFPEVAPEPIHTQMRRHVKPTRKQVAAIYLGYPGTTIDNTTDRYALYVLDAVLSGIGFPGGWLHTELRGKQLVYVVHALSWLGLEPGYFGIIAATQPQKVDEVVAIIRSHIDKAKAGEISDEELQRAKRLTLIADRLDMQTNSQLASDAALNELYGLGYDFSQHDQQRLNAVTKAEVQRVAQKYLNHPTIVITTPNTGQR